MVTKFTCIIFGGIDRNVAFMTQAYSYHLWPFSLIMDDHRLLRRKLELIIPGRPSTLRELGGGIEKGTRQRERTQSRVTLTT